MKPIFFILVIVFIAGCSTSPQDPAHFRVHNDRTTKANVQVKTSGGFTININDVASGATTTYQDAAPGRIDVTAGIQSESVSPTAFFFAAPNASYTIVVANTNPPTISIATP